VAVREKAKSLYTKSRTIQMRAKETERLLIDRAAEIVGKNRSEFIIESSLNEAKKVLLDQTSFQLNESAWRALLEILDAPTKKNRKLEGLMKQAAPWELEK
jgi:uncharacterized protein (DUF1778 family)